MYNKNKKIIVILSSIIIILLGILIKNNIDKDPICLQQFVSGNYIDYNIANRYFNLKTSEKAIEYYNGTEYYISYYDYIDEDIILCEIYSIGKCAIIYKNPDNIYMIYESNGQTQIQKFFYNNSTYMRIEHTE